MTLEEACNLAQAIRGNSKYEVIAIGRFVPIESLSNSLPWGLSVLTVADGKKNTVWNEDDWRRLATTKPEPEPKADQKKAAAVTATEELQLTLF